MKTFFCLLSLAFSFTCSTAVHAETQEPSEQTQQKTRRVRRPGMRILKEGGLVQEVNTGRVVRVVNSTSLSNSAVEQMAQSLRTNLRFPVEVVTLKAPSDLSKDRKYAVHIYLKAAGNTPALLVAPEEAWASVNVEALEKDAPPDDVFIKRVNKEFWRATAMALGASNSMFQPCLMSDVFSLADLDAISLPAPCPEPFNKMMNTARHLGIFPSRRVTYKRACEEGWAPAPTNDVQKAIYEQVKADKERGPTNPLKIVPPKKP